MISEEENEKLLQKLEGISPVSMKVFQVFIRVMRLYKQLTFKMISKEGIYPGQAACLWFASQHPGMSQRELALKLHVTPPTATVMLQKMEKSGLIVRKTDEKDQRLTRMYVSDNGEKLVNKLCCIFAELINAGLDGMSEQDQMDFIRLLDQLSYNITQKL